MKKGRFSIVKKAERKQTSLVANLGDFNRPLHVRPVRYLGREWWSISPEDIWAGMVMDLRRLGFEAVAMNDEVLVREDFSSSEELQMDGLNASGGLKPFPVIHPAIRVYKESALPEYSYFGQRTNDRYDEDGYDEEDEVEDEWVPVDLDNQE